MGVIGSHAPFFVELTLLSGGTAISLRADEFLISLNIEEVSIGAWVGQAVLFDPEGDFLENLIIAAGVDRQLRVKFGRGDQFPDETREYTAAIPIFQPNYEPHGITLTLDLLAAPVLQSMVDKKVRSFNPDIRISDMVRFIAEDRGWTFIIEPTQGTMTEPFSSNGESDLQFIRQMLIPQAVSEGTGEGGYVLNFDRENVLHFHTPDFIEPEVHHFLYSRDAAGDVISFSPEDASLFGKLMGGGNLQFGGVGSLLGQATQVIASQTSGVVGTSGSPVQSDGSAKKDLGPGAHAYWDAATRDLDELARLAQVRFDTYRRFEYVAVLVVHGTNRARMNDYVNVDYIKRNGTLHYTSGRFQIFKRRHTIDSSGWQTEFECMRFGIPALEGTSTLTASQTNEPGTASGGGAAIDLPVDN